MDRTTLGEPIQGDPSLNCSYASPSLDFEEGDVLSPFFLPLIVHVYHPFGEIALWDSTSRKAVQWDASIPS